MEEYNGMPADVAEATDAAEAREGGFDAILRDRAMQSEFDRRVSKALDTARAKWEQEQQRRDEALRAEILASAREQAEEDCRQREEEISRKEREIARRELRSAALDQLKRRGLPPELAQTLSFDDQAGMERAIDAAEAAFRSAVRQGMEERLQGMYPEAGALIPRSEDMDDESYYRMNYLKKHGGKNT